MFFKYNEANNEIVSALFQYFFCPDNNFLLYELVATAAQITQIGQVTNKPKPTVRIPTTAEIGIIIIAPQIVE